MTANVIEQTIAAWTAEPAKALGTPTVKAQSDGATAVIESGSFRWTADLPPGLGGTNQAPSPTAMLLGALAGCAVVFIRDTLAPQLGVLTTSVEATASCGTDARGLLAMDGAEPDLQNLKLDIRVHSPDGPEAVARLASAWQERCPIYLALIKAVEVQLTIAAA
jgi:uncharacterized OsmC-like protein